MVAKAVAKYALPFGPFSPSRITLSMPIEAEVLTAQMLHNAPVLWALIDPTAHKMDRVFEVAEADALISAGSLLYVGTVQLNGGAKVLHVFEVLA